MKWLNRSRAFAACVRSPQDVRDAFRGHRAFHLWWSLTLRLHGKPVRQDLSPDRERAIVADGLAFYVGLYRSLGAIMLVLLTSFGILSPGQDMAPWMTLAAASGMFLWLATGLGARGVRDYRHGHAGGQTQLIVFIVLLTWFLVAVAILASTYLHDHHSVPLWANVAGTALFVVIGIGSYCIELIYLVAAGGLRRSGPANTAPMPQ